MWVKILVNVGLNNPFDPGKKRDHLVMVISMEDTLESPFSP